MIVYGYLFVVSENTVVPAELYRQFHVRRQYDKMAIAMCRVSLTNIEVQDNFGTTVATTTFPETLRSYSAVRKSFSASIQGHGIVLLQGDRYRLDGGGSWAFGSRSNHQELTIKDVYI